MRIAEGMLPAEICARTVVSGLGMGGRGSKFEVRMKNQERLNFCILHSNLELRTSSRYASSPFSCSSWQSMQYGVQGTADRRFSPIWLLQLVQVPKLPSRMRLNASSISMSRLRSPSEREKLSS